MSDPVLVERDGAVATLTLNRPDALNTLDFAMMEALVAQTAALAADDALRVVVVRGAGKHFMAGGDLRSFATRLDVAPDARRAEFQAMIERLHAAIEHLHRMPAIAVAQVRGAVAGFGLSLLCACDLAIAADDAYFTTAYRHIALTPDGGGTWGLPRIVGLRKAMEMLLLSERYDASEALRLGLVNRVVPVAELDATVAAIVQSLASGPRMAIANAKRLARESLDRSLSEQLQAEAVSFARCVATPDFPEGIRAFLEKRPAKFEP
ncbi:MAG TPA: enoyl-CoA hydratase-related protein [Casimicrobiaceae bacterium]|nr:enoyl-CoA hydratase-related protein [Casimicrobiaceae bacterium]